jgi:hypothetical protein
LAAAAATRGYEILRGVVPADAIDRALRHGHLDIVRNGLPAAELARWLWSAHWFPHLDPELPHSSGINRTGGIRYAVYFRFLEPRG